MAEKTTNLEGPPEKQLTNSTDYIRTSLADAYAYYQNNKTLDGWETKDSYSLSNAMGASQMASNTLRQNGDITNADIEKAFENTSYSSATEYKEAYLAYTRGKWNIIQATKIEENLLKKEVGGNPESTKITKEESIVASEEKPKINHVLEKNTKNPLTEKEEIITDLSTLGTKPNRVNQSSEKREGMNDASILGYNKQYIKANQLGNSYYTEQFPELDNPTRKNILAIQNKLSIGFENNTTKTIKLTQDGILGKNTVGEMRKFIDNTRLSPLNEGQKKETEKSILLNLDQKDKEKIIGEGITFIDKIIANSENFKKFTNYNARTGGYYLEDIVPFNQVFLKGMSLTSKVMTGDLQMKTNFFSAYEEILSSNNRKNWLALNNYTKKTIIEQLNTEWKKRANEKIKKLNTELNK